MQRPPRHPGEPLLSGFLIWRVIFVSTILLAGTFGLFMAERAAGTDLATARTVAVNTLVLFEVFYLLSCRHLLTPALHAGALRGAAPAGIAIATVLMLQALMTYTPWLQHLFDTRALDAATWGRMVLVAASVFVLVELEKWLVRHTPGRGGPANGGRSARQPA